MTGSGLPGVGKIKKAAGIIGNAVSTGLLFLVLLLAVLLVGVRLAGYTPYAILSGSMTPKYKTGDLVYVKRVPPEEIRPGDVITFVANSDLLVVTHRVVEADLEKGFFRTKGDANDTPDGAPVWFENVLGRAEFGIPKLGFLAARLREKRGRYLAAAFFLSVMLLMVLSELIKPEDGSAYAAGKGDVNAASPVRTVLTEKEAEAPGGQKPAGQAGGNRF